MQPRGLPPPPINRHGLLSRPTTAVQPATGTALLAPNVNEDRTLNGVGGGNPPFDAGEEPRFAPTDALIEVVRPHVSRGR